MLSFIKAALSTYTKIVFSGEQRSHSTLGGNNRVRKNNNSWQKQSVFFPVGRVKPPVFAFRFFFNFPTQTAINWDLAYPKSWKREEEKQHILMRKSYLGGGSGSSYPTPASIDRVTVCKGETTHCSNIYSLAEELAALAQKAISKDTDVTQVGAL